MLTYRQDRQGGRQINKQAGSLTLADRRKTDLTGTDRPSGKQADGQTGRVTNMQTDRQENRQTGRLMPRHGICILTDRDR